MTLADKLSHLGNAPLNPKRKKPLWDGPESPGENGGITFSMLSRWLVCRERFRLRFLEGLTTPDSFNHRLEYGNMWHLCEEAYARGVNPLHQEPTYPGSKDLTWGELGAYARGLGDRYPLSREKIDHWYNVCRVQFQEYLRYWKKHPDTKDRTSLLAEQVFDIPFNLPSGRVVRLRGKWDGVDLIGNGRHAGIYLYENKTKGEVDEVAIKKQLQFDCQTMLYMVALWGKPSCDLPREGYFRHQNAVEYPIRGVRYNVVRRPLSGGKHSITRHKATSKKAEETKSQFYERLGGLIAENPQDFFVRFRSEVSSGDIKRFKNQFLIPCLEDLCCWYDNQKDAMERGIDPFSYLGHWQWPFGIFSPLLEGYETDYDGYLATGSLVGLVTNDVLFRELREDV